MLRPDLLRQFRPACKRCTGGSWGSGGSTVVFSRSRPFKATGTSDRILLGLRCGHLCAILAYSNTGPFRDFVGKVTCVKCMMVMPNLQERIPGSVEPPLRQSRGHLLANRLAQTTSRCSATPRATTSGVREARGTLRIMGLQGEYMSGPWTKPGPAWFKGLSGLLRGLQRRTVWNSHAMRIAREKSSQNTSDAPPDNVREICFC